MKSLKQLITRVQEDWSEIGDTLLGSGSQRILDDEIRRVDSDLRDLRNELLACKAGLFTARERSEALSLAIAAREDQATRALRQRRKSLAREIATLIAALERDQACEAQQVSAIESQFARLQHLVQQGEGKLRRLKYQLDTIRVTESLQRAQEVMGGRRDGRGLGPRGALDLLKRSPGSGQGDGTGRIDVHAQGEDALDARLREAGVIDEQGRVDEVMARLEKRTKAAASRRGPPAKT